MLVVTITAHTGNRYDFAVDRQSFVIGRSRSADLRLPSEAISGEHVRIESVGDSGRRVTVCDLGSANGSTLDGRPLDANQPVEAELPASLSLGGVALELKWSDEPAGASLTLEDSHSLELERLRTLIEPSTEGPAPGESSPTRGAPTPERILGAIAIALALALIVWFAGC